jgi:septal ring factor EnvC (AmiA/AmiB activator)
VALIALTPAIITMSGCIVGEIQDQVVTANHGLEEVNEEMNRITELLVAVQKQLEQVERTNELLIETQAQLKTMDSIDASLKNLDVHLASLRRTLDNIDSTIPFLKLTSDDEIEAEGAEGVEGEGAADEATPGGGEAVPPPEGDNDDPPPASSPRGGQ